MFDARLTPVVASITAPAQSPSVAFTLGSETGKSSCRFEADLIVVDHQLFRLFYVPPWQDAQNATLVADLTNAVSLHKQALREKVKVVARLGHPGWVLLHACVVRFLARGDGRWT